MTAANSVEIRCTYILPIRRSHASHSEVADLAAYFKELALAGCEVIVVDGSPAETFAEHHRTWRKFCRHVIVDPRYSYQNGKVNGVCTGVDLASCESIVLADDDIRYTFEDIQLSCDLLERHEMVRPQNYLSPLPWWGRMEAARMLVNRGALRSGDYPGTCAFRRSTFVRIGQYDGDVLFDNEEIVRHFIISGARVCFARNFFILKRPPTLRKWLEQRPRQAYEDFTIRAKTVFFMSVLPIAVTLTMLAGPQAAGTWLLLITGGALLLAGRGLWRDQAYRFFPAHVVLFTPLWLLERGLSVYWALYWRTVYAGYPFGERLLSKSTGRAWTAAKPHLISSSKNLYSTLTSPADE